MMAGMKRRDFVRGAAAIPAAMMAQDDWTFVGIQANPHIMLDEGLDHCLDLMKETARINAVVAYSHSYYSARAINTRVLAPDHGVPVRQESRRKLPRVWVRHNEKYFRNTPLRHHEADSSYEYAGRDLFAELVEPARKRGMKIYARILEAQAKDGLGFIKNWDKVLTVDLHGKQGSGPCWNNPDYREWVRATTEDMFRSYELDGLQYGAERVGPLSETLFRGHLPYCFCEHCVKANRARGMGVERAKKGYSELHKLMTAVHSSGAIPEDGVMTTVLRIMQRYPEVLGWNYQWLQADQEIAAMIYKTAKEIKPDADVGQHVDHQRSSWDIFFRAASTYEEMAENSDFIKPILYHDILAPRMRWWVLDRMKTRVLADMSEEQALALFYAWFRLDPETEPPLDELARSGFSPDYVFRETRRCVVGVKGKAKIYAGIGFDVPWGETHYPSEPEKVYRSVLRAFEAGADGVLASRKT
jgi:hypothetical protein